MFNGIIFNTGKVQNLKKNKNSVYVGIKTKINFTKKDLGSSICCDGVCLTIEKIIKDKIFFYISNETLKRSNFKNLKLNQTINLEKSLTMVKKFLVISSRGMLIRLQKLKKYYL